MSNDNEEDRIWPEYVDEADLLRSELAATKAASLAVVKTLQGQIDTLTAALAKANKEIEDDRRYMASTWEYEPRGWQGGGESNL